MSYARFGCDNSDVYVYAHVNGGVTCCGCRMSDSHMGSVNLSAADMLVHLQRHCDAGDLVSQACIDDVRSHVEN